MANKVVLCADSTCDLGDQLRDKYNVTFFPYTITLEDETFIDGVTIQPEDIYKAYREKGILPKTSAINIADYIDFFRKWTDQGYDVVHLSLGSALSSSYQNCVAAAQAIGNVYPVDSCNLSSGIALLVLEAAERIAKGMSAKDVAEEVSQLTRHSHASFILDTLEFMRAGGRCSAVAAMGSNLLKLKPCIEVDNSSGAMGVGKIYRGNLDKVLLQYAEERLNRYQKIKKDRAFITHSGISEERIQMVYDYVKSRNIFDEIFVTRASCTISSHCGPNTLGVLFMTED
jgi:DegV family protein with EDD domain